jgi:hypothetical protein
MKRSQFFILAIFFMGCFLGMAEAQPTKSMSEDIVHRIEQGYQRGEIDYDTAILNMAYALYEPTKVDRRFFHPPIRVGKCGTPILREIRNSWNGLRPETKDILRQFINGTIEQEYTYDSPGGHFQLHYDRTGRDAVPPADANQNDVPDYIERAALYFDWVWQFEVDSLGYLPPPPDDGRMGDDRYDVVFEDMFFYGYTVLLSETSSASYIAIENDFRGFPPNDDPEGERWGALKVTAAHEFFHACQFVYDTDEAIWFSEVTAVWMEETAFDMVNDYYNYLPGFFSRPDEALDQGFPYEKVVWGLYLSQNFGGDIIHALWEECGTIPHDNALAAHDPVLQRYGTTLPETFKGFTVWNYLTGDRANGSHPHYEEAALYPQVEQCAVHSQYPLIERPGCPLDHLASCYLSFLSFHHQDALELTFSGQAGLPWKVMMVLVKGSGPGAEFTSLELPLEDEASGCYFFAEPDIYSQLILVPSLHASQGKAIPFTYSATLPRPLMIDHVPAQDTQEIPGPYCLVATISPPTLVDSSSVLIHYGFDLNPPVDHEEPMSRGGQPDLYQGEIPPQPGGTIVSYFISALDTAGRLFTAPPGAPESLYTFVIYADTIPPMIVHEPPSWISVASFPLEIAVQVTDPYGLESVHVIYKNGSSANEIIALMTESETLPDLYAGMIASAFEKGDTLLYRIEALDGSPQMNRAHDPEIGYYAVNVDETPTIEMSLDLMTGWNMVSLPLVPENRSVEALFPGNVGVFTWTGNDSYERTDTLQIGYGYWLALLEPQRFVLSGIPAIHYTREIITGWNMIGGGAFPADTTALRDHPEGIILPQTPWWYDPGQGAYLRSEILEPGRGYWIGSMGNGALTFDEEMPVPRATEMPEVAVPCATVSLHQGTLTTILEFGCSSGATARFDPNMDRPVPPHPPTQTPFDAFFVVAHEKFYRLQRDVRSIETAPRWELSVQSASPVSLQWDISALPPDLKVVLNGESGAIDMRTTRSLTIDSGGRYEITANRGRVVPEGYALYQNVPNPFNPDTEIRFQIAENGHPSYTCLRVYNILGQGVKTLVKGEIEPGTHFVEWDGRDDSGNDLPSGLYFVRMHSGRFEDVRKMVVLK